MAIDVGDACIARPEGAGDTFCHVNKGNPANASGTLTNVCIYIEFAATIVIGVFYVLSGNILKCRSAHTCSVSPGKNNVPVNMAINAGDYIGAYCSSNAWIAATRTAGAGVWHIHANKCVEGLETNFNFTGNIAISVYGTGVVGPPPPPPPLMFTCPYCGATFPTPAHRDAHIATEHPPAPPLGTLKCPICGRDLGIPSETVEYVEIVSSPAIDQLLAEITVLDAKIAELKARIANVRAEITRHQEILGL